MMTMFMIMMTNDDNDYDGNNTATNSIITSLLRLLILLLCGRHIGRVTRLARPSVRLFSVCPVRACNWKNVEKSKLVQTFPGARVTGMPIFS